ncbi:hypothetical protein B0O40_1981 [Ruminococcaceae bacterium R-25]|nr:hypothetical protein B0O40_1981 [Ruminococcaceae bacterium R-25]SUQ21842.1 hypothetical protein SAMN06297423_1981 [Oscillospiraceae bacterium]
MSIISKSNNGWELHTVSNGSLSCENSKLDSNDIDIVEKKILPEYGERMKKEHVFVSWDNWSGVFIMALPGLHTDNSDKLIKELFERLRDNS